MPKKPGAYHRPETIEEALQLLSKPDSVPLAGGTKLLASEAGLPVDHVVDLQALGLNQVKEKDGEISIGATCTLTDLSAALARDYPSDAASILLRETIRREGPNTYRNAATIGGSAAVRLPDSELLAALLVLDARLSFAGRPSSDAVSLSDYLAAEERPAGLITSVIVPIAEGQGATERVARTPADYPIVSVVAWRPSGQEIRLAATGIAALPKRVPEAEAVTAVGLNEETIVGAARAAAGAAEHPGDFRGDAAYRAKMAEVLTRRVLNALA